MYEPSLTDLRALLAIATHRSFRKAADELALSPSTLSHMMRVLEEKLGVRLLHRTTRSVAPTEAGEHLLRRVEPLLLELRSALEDVNGFRARPEGTLRLNASEPVARVLLQDAVPAFQRRYPEVRFDLFVDNRLVDIVAEGFDAGIRLAEAVPQDMNVVLFGGPFRFLPVAAPAYLEQRGLPRVPDDLLGHACIRIRMQSGRVYRWEFARRGETLAIDVPGSLTLNQIELMIEAAAAGLGIAYVPEFAARPLLREGRLLPLLADWCLPPSELALYYSGHRHVPAALRAFIGVLQESFPPAGRMP